MFLPFSLGFNLNSSTTGKKISQGMWLHINCFLPGLLNVLNAILCTRLSVWNILEAQYKLP